MFLIEREKTAVLAEILMEDDRFESIMQNLHKRSAYHVEHVQPAIEKIGTEFYPKVLEAEMGLRHTETMKHLTDALYDQIDRSLISLLSVINKLHDAMKEIHPNFKFVNIIGLEPLTTPQEAPATIKVPDYSWR
jgi:hypothetical protein